MEESTSKFASVGGACPSRRVHEPLFVLISIPVLRFVDRIWTARFIEVYGINELKLECKYAEESSLEVTPYKGVYTGHYSSVPSLSDFVMSETLEWR